MTRSITATAARVVAVLVSLVVLLPGVASSAWAGELAGPTEVQGAGGYRSLTVSFLPPSGGGPRGSAAPTYEFQVGETWRALAVKPVGDSGRVQGTVSGLVDGGYYFLTVRARYDGSASPPAYGPQVRTFAAPDEFRADPVPWSRSIGIYAPPPDPQYDEPAPDGLRLTATPKARRLPTRSLLCTDGASCVVRGLVNGRGYRFSVTAFYDHELPDGRTVRLRAKPRVTERVVPWDGPQAPRSLAAQPADSGATLTWAMGQGFPGSESMWTVFEAKVGDRWRYLPATYDAGSYTGKVIGLTNGRPYAIRVRGVTNDGKPGLRSRLVTVTPAVPGAD